jgi:hypothetical protein
VILHDPHEVVTKISSAAGAASNLLSHATPCFLIFGTDGR